jgi:hypothetical protein
MNKSGEAAKVLIHFIKGMKYLLATCRFFSVTVNAINLSYLAITCDIACLWRILGDGKAHESNDALHHQWDANV